jgi:hypothetical protein
MESSLWNTEILLLQSRPASIYQSSQFIRIVPISISLSGIFCGTFAIGIHMGIEVCIIPMKVIQTWRTAKLSVNVVHERHMVPRRLCRYCQYKYLGSSRKMPTWLAIFRAFSTCRFSPISPISPILPMNKKHLLCKFLNHCGIECFEICVAHLPSNSGSHRCTNQVVVWVFAFRTCSISAE